MNRLLIILAVVAVALIMMGCLMRSSYKLSPTSITLSEPKQEPGAIFDLPNELKCVPGSNPEASYYTKDLTPGGICGAQEFVKEQADYSIVGGIGGSLLDD
jgi:hypothetical protein